jgi:hypothetical protein
MFHPRHWQIGQSFCPFELNAWWWSQEPTLEQGTLNGEYRCTVDLRFDCFGISCMATNNFCFYLQNRPIQICQTGGQWYSDTSPISIPCLEWDWVFVVNIVLGLKDSSEKNTLAYLSSVTYEEKSLTSKQHFWN